MTTGSYAPEDKYSVFIYLAKADGTLAAPKKVPFQAVAFWSSLAIADLDGDGRVEIVVGHDTGITIIRWNAGAPTAQVVAAVPMQFSDYAANAVSVLDVDRDGHLDVVGVGNGIDITIFFGDGAGGFARQKRFDDGTDSAGGDPDLEAEFIRALGIEGVEAVIAGQGELESFRRLQAQPYQRDRPVEHQLARFFGGRSGNKVRYAGLLAEAVSLESIPAPLASLLASL